MHDVTNGFGSYQFSGSTGYLSVCLCQSADLSINLPISLNSIFIMLGGGKVTDFLLKLRNEEFEVFPTLERRRTAFT